ncbi:uncharacterized protein LOC109789585 [Cajanus cajan]|uniref:Uncharacterized protein n=1 Tax=Cajanus cajan TaxID=3821 RepID=A0A151R740_CAJCA|nr:uncharacterized protein LOC109789585 [Cajanus cajan]KYP38185.1 hypothetical protein KK1_040578 [Cajanus cajan]
MAHPVNFTHTKTKVLLLSLVFFLSLSACFSAFSDPQSSSSTRRMLGARKEDQEKPLKKKTAAQSTKLINPTTPLSSKNQTKTIKSNNISSKNQTKTIKTNLSSKTQTKITKTTLSSKNQTKPLKPSSNSPSKAKTTPTDTSLKKLNNSTTQKIKKLNVTSKPNPVPTSSKKSLDLAKASNKTTKATATKVDTNKKQKTPPKKPTKQAPPSWFIDEDEEDGLVSLSEFTDLPNKFHRTLIPDLERISTTSKAYITKANNEMTKGFKPYVGKKYAPTVATIISCAFIFIPLILVSLLCNTIKAYFSLQKILIFIQVYLSIYFTILCVTSLFTGLEPLKFLYSTSRSTYMCLQVLQTLAYVFYLLLLLMYLVLVFSTDCGLGSRLLGLAQIFVGFAVGLHYYVTVFHRVVLQQPPKTNWKIHGIYATCFLLICVLARVDRRKKTYVEDGGGEGKRN